MNAKVAIVVERLSKQFKLFTSPKERLLEALHPWRNKRLNDFWALKDVSFEIRQGETVGIIGRNGSGKSTLLQIIAGVMQPTQGTIRVNGRLGTILELGAGFDPEFTGRQNAELNGAIAGLSRTEVLNTIPHIEAFADIGPFFDQPVKVYSTGMYARLAFACSIHINPDVLIIDEALSVGDAKFQNKCHMHFKRLQAEGRAILVVSHSTEMILRQCTRAILIDEGRLVADGEPQRVVDRYYEMLFPSSRREESALDRLAGKTVADPALSYEVASDMTRSVRELVYPNGRCEERNTYNKGEFRFGDREVEIADYILFADGKMYPVEIESGARVTLYVRLRSHGFEGCLSAGFAIKTVEGVKLFGTNTIVNGVRLPQLVPGSDLWIRFDFQMNVGPGDIFIDVGCGDWTAPPARPLDRRHSVIHVVVTGDGKSDGVCNCFATVSVAVHDQETDSLPPPYEVFRSDS
ncbi:MAG: ABC transporter ATP-binding protein [Nitrospira sp.]|nr:ABC transporter ATP-binding protein [Nitrospira sp.]